MKESVKAFLIEDGYDVNDIGAFNGESVDYTDFGIKVASEVSRGNFYRGVLICGTGIGMSIVANRFPGVRAALCGDLFSTIMSRRHNDANILVMGARVIGEGLALELVKTWLNTPFEGGRHQKRLKKIDQINMKDIYSP
jgi:ribose 5-phosphate isomerase B